MAPVGAAARKTLDRFVAARSGLALLLDVPSGQLIAASDLLAAGQLLWPPGSTIKPFVLMSLLKFGRLSPNTAFVCPHELRIGRRTFDCSHPKLATPLQVDTAIAYSCNCFVARAAESLRPGELGAMLAPWRLGSHTDLTGKGEAVGRIESLRDVDRQRMQALGEDGIAVTAAEIALAYRSLALEVQNPEFAPILKGLEGAVEYGTGQRAAVKGVSIAGKTGSTISWAGEPLAWFAGFMPSRAPRVVVAVMLAGRSGGSDAAPVAGKILEAHRAGIL